MLSRSFPILITPLLGLVGLALPLGCVNTDPTVDNSVTITNPIEEVDTAVNDTSPDIATQSVIISGHTATVDGTPLAGAWVAVADNSTQQVVNETSSDASGAFTLTLDGEVGDYTLVASHGDGETMLAAWQGFSVYDDQVEDLTFNLNLAELLIFEESDDGAAPPPSGGCYMVYTRQRMCSWHVWYAYTYYASGWACFALGGGYSWTPVGSC